MHNDDSMHLEDEINKLQADLNEVLDILENVMGFDKGPNEEEFIEWANQTLPVMHRHGRRTSVIEFI